MTATKFEQLVNHVVDLFPNRATLGGEVVQVVDGPGTADMRNNILMIGYSLITSAYSNVTYTGSSNQQYATLGKPTPTRKEELELNCSLLVGVGNQDMRACRAKAMNIYNGIGDTFRESAGTATAGGIFQHIQIARYRVYQDSNNDGVSVGIEFTVTATARV
jgi:hypothetical protein